jgi:hypothetical protein
VDDGLFVPASFAVPGGLTAEHFRLEPLGPQHNAADFAAWTTSIDHIQATPGFTGTGWPRPMTLSDNLRDLERHAQDFAGRNGFTYTVLATGTDEIIGCVYIYPPLGASAGELCARVKSWVSADFAALDTALYEATRAWLERSWPFQSIDYQPRS